MDRKKSSKTKKDPKGKTRTKKPQFTDSPLVHLRRNLNVVASRLSRIGDLAGRHTLEKPEISIDAYLSRLRKRKSALIKEVKSLSKKQAARGMPERVLPRPRPPLSGIAEVYQRGLLQELAQTKQVPPLDCIGPSGLQAPIAYGEILFDQTGIFHDSTYSIKLDTKWFETRGFVKFMVDLDDDASIWRDDNPDRVKFGFEVYWELPAAPCDCTVECKIGLGGWTEFTNGADDGGEYKTYVALVNTDQDGEWPNEPIDVSVLGDNFLSGNVSIAVLQELVRSCYFFIRKGKKAQVALGFVGSLWAQDGLAELDVGFGVHRVGLSTDEPRPPMLSYTMDPWDPACFITTAVCRALGKPDDCYELAMLRKFRDSYVRDLPQGNELIEEYYVKAQQLLRAIESKPDRGVILQALYDGHLKHVIEAVEHGDNRQAVGQYTEMLRWLETVVSRR